MTTAQNLGWEEAIIRTLSDAGGPLHYKEIAHRIAEKQLRGSFGATPENTVGAYLSGRMLEAGRVERVDAGVYQIRSSSNPVSASEIAEAKEEAKVSSVAAYGLYWERDKVNWHPGQGRRIPRRLLGKADDSDTEVDFAEQAGVYMLHDHQTVMYVGRTYVGKA